MIIIEAIKKWQFISTIMECLRLMHHGVLMRVDISLIFILATLTKTDSQIWLYLIWDLALVARGEFRNLPLQSCDFPVSEN